MATRVGKIRETEAAIAELPTPAAGKSPIYRFEGGSGLAIRVTDSGRKHTIGKQFCRAVGARHRTGDSAFGV